MTLCFPSDPVKLNSTIDKTKQREANVGCPSQYDWCKNTPQIWLPQMLFAVVLFSIGFSSCIGLILSLYTKVLGFKKQVRLFYIPLSIANMKDFSETNHRQPSQHGLDVFKSRYNVVKL